MGLSTKYPVLLFPLRLEAKFVKVNRPSPFPDGEQLWIRVFPDDILMPSFNPKINEIEKKLQEEYFHNIGSVSIADKKRKWNKLVEHVGVPKALYLINTEELEKSGPLNYLPDKFSVTISYRRTWGSGTKTKEGKFINKNILLDPEETDSWLTNFDKAVKIGLGLKITLPDSVKYVEKITVVGISDNSGVEDSAKKLEKLFKEHKYSDDFALLSFGTATNNTEKTKVPYSSRARFDTEASFKNIQPIPSRFLGEKMNKALGLSENNKIFDNIKSPDRGGLPEEKDEIRKLFRSIIALTLGKNTIESISLSSSLSVQGDLKLGWQHFVKYVNGQGHLPTIQVDNQPYGILPTSRNLPNFEGSGNEFDTRLRTFLEDLRKKWDKLIKKLPQIGNSDNPDEELLQIMSMQPQSDRLQWRVLKKENPEDFGVTLDENGGLIAMAGPSSSASGNPVIPEIYKNIGSLDKLLKPFYRTGEKKSFNLLFLNSLGSKPVSNIFPRKHLLSADIITALNKFPSPFRQEIEATGLTTNSSNDSSTLQTFVIDYLTTVKTSNLQEEENNLRTLVKLLKEDYWEEQKETATAAFFEAIDLISHRLDAWFTSFAVKKLEGLRQGEYKTGIHLGAYGYVENLRRKSNNNTGTANRDIPGGFIHAPSIQQAIAAAIAKSAFLTHYEQNKANPFALNLTSDRVEKSIFLQEGLRNDQELGALLGYEFERMLGGNPDVAKFIPQFRSEYPMAIVSVEEAPEADALSIVPEINVVDGNQLLIDFNKNKNLFFRNLKIRGSEKVKIKAILQKLNDYFDASLDTLLYEAGYQAVKGNFDQSAAAMNAFKGEKDPPPLRGQKTSVSGTGINHKFMMFLEASPAIPNHETNPKGAVEPTLEHWVKQCLGDFSEIGSCVQFHRMDENGNKVAVLDLNRIPADAINENLRNIKFDIHPVLIDKILELRNADTLIEDYQLFEPFVENEQIEASDLEKLKKHTYFFKKLDSGVEESICWNGINVTLNELEIGYLDFMYMAGKGINTGSSEFDIHLKHFLQLNYGFPDDLYFTVMEAPLVKKSIPDAVDVAYSLQLFLGNTTYLKETDTSPAYHNPVMEAVDHSDAINQINGALELLREMEKWLLENFDENGLEVTLNLKTNIEKIKCLTKYGCKTAINLLSEKSENWLPNLKAEIREKIVKTANCLTVAKSSSNSDSKIKNLKEAAKALFGNDFVLLPKCRFNSDFKEGFDAFKDNEERIVGEDKQERVQLWVQGMAQVNKAFESFEDWQMEMQSWNNTTNPWEYSVVQMLEEEKNGIEQVGINSQLPWVALSKKERGGQDYPKGVYAMVTCAPNSLAAENLAYGLVINSFTEHIPNEQITTGVSFQYDAPNTEPPQTILLAVPDHEMGDEWEIDHLKSIVTDTIDLAKIRMVDLDAMQKGDLGFLFPATFIPPPKPELPQNPYPTAKLEQSFLLDAVVKSALLPTKTWVALAVLIAPNNSIQMISDAGNIGEIEGELGNDKRLKIRTYKNQKTVYFSNQQIKINLKHPINNLKISIGTKGEKLKLDLFDTQGKKIEHPIVELQSESNEIATVRIVGNDIKRINIQGTGYLQKIKISEKTD